MGNGANRLFNVMKLTSEGTNLPSSQVTSLTVKSIQPLIFSRDDKLEIPNDFCIFNENVNPNSLKVGDIVIAMVFNNGQSYFIQQIENNNELLKYSDVFYKKGDTYSNSYLILTGMITSGATYVGLPIYLPKRLDNIDTITLNTLKMEARGTKGYLNNMPGTHDYKIDSDYTIEINKRTENYIFINLTKSSAFTNVDNNTPVVFTGQFSCTFN